MPDIAAPLPSECPNCAAPVHGPYCAQCGQETAIAIPRLRDFAHEYAAQFVSLEGRLWRTLWLLVSQPGRLTLDFLEGRRRRYVRPLPLYLSLSFLFFLLLALFPGDALKVDTSSGPGAAQTGRPGVFQGEILQLDGTESSWVEAVFPNYRRTLKRLELDPQGARKQLASAFVAKLPAAIFLLVPVFAMASAVLYLRRRRHYMEHLLLALHVHAFVFLSLALAYPFAGEALAPLLLVLWWGHLALALRRVFGGRLLPQLLRAATLMLFHGMLLVVALVLALLFALTTI